MPESRRHRLIWFAVACGHVALLAAVVAGGLRSSAKPVREGGVILVSLVSDPVASPGEAPRGVALGAGPVQPVPVPAVPAPVSVAPSVSAPPASGLPSEKPSPLPAPVAEAPVAVAAPLPVPADTYAPPAFRVHEEPAYPDRARRAGVEGEVVVKVRLSERGEILRVELVRSSGSRLLDEAALAAARASQFTPAERNRVPVEAEATATYRFELR